MSKVKKTHKMPDGTVMDGATHPKTLIKKLKVKKYRKGQGSSYPRKSNY